MSPLYPSKKQCRRLLSPLSTLIVWLLLSLPLTAAEPPLHEIYRLIDERLELMESVALYKQAHQLPVEDLKREQLVIDQVVVEAKKLNLDPATTEAFFRVQMEAGKQVQRSWLSRWKQQPPDNQEVPDLARTIRPKLDEINARMLHVLNASLPTLVESYLYDAHRQAFEQQVTVEQLTDPNRKAIFNTLLAVGTTAPPDYSRLDQVIARGYLRIGTTGDYPPFSEWRQQSGDFAGIDIDLARDLAKTLGVEPVFQRTSWPQLSNDLIANRYDIALSGISITLARQRIGFFSQRYYLGGKTPIARCVDRERFSSLEQIDQPGVRVIFNPGGTNQQFAENSMKQATLITHPDNSTIFDEIINGRADAMITDDIEVMLQSRQHTELCPTMPGNTLTKSGKGVLLPRDPVLKGYIDVWLEQMRLDGKIDRLFSDHMITSPIHH